MYRTYDHQDQLHQFCYFTCFREQRITGMCIHLLIGLSALVTAVLRVSIHAPTRLSQSIIANANIFYSDFCLSYVTYASFIRKY